MEKKPPERRLFPRIESDFPAVVAVTDSKDLPQEDRVRLLDVSGGGVRFASRSGIYQVGQRVRISIYLPATSDVKAFMQGLGTVVRVQKDTRTESPSQKKTEIAISLDTPLRLVRSLHGEEEVGTRTGD